jgi:ppGpp synthetase/RelA/SpoT-type nucleotidyltranferase
MATFSKAQIDRLGDRLRIGKIANEDLQLLDAYRRSFTSAYEAVVQALSGQLKLRPTGRPAKSTTSIMDKLRRESLRLSQMQDIAGCRVIVDDEVRQDEAVAGLMQAFVGASLFDRREVPSHGYRAVHVVVRHDGSPIEVQIRTVLQHRWAELSEKLSDVVHVSVKYGGGPAKLREMLLKASSVVKWTELSDRRSQDLQARLENSQATLPVGNLVEELAGIIEDVNENKRQLTVELERMIEEAHVWKDYDDDAVSN